MSPKGARARLLPFSPGAFLVPDAVAEVLNDSTSTEAPDDSAISDSSPSTGTLEHHRQTMSHPGCGRYMLLT